MKQNKKSTLQVIHEYASVITKYYLVAMLVFLPLYKTNGFANIADAKFVIFKLLTTSYLVICGGIFLIEEGIHIKNKTIEEIRCIPVLLICLHLLANIVSFIFSIDHTTSFWGYGSWHMGIFTQSMILFSALLVYNYYVDDKIIWVAALIGIGATSLLTILNRFDIYPIDMGNKYPGFISTLGQTNWATIYVACLLGACLGLYIYEEKLVMKIAVLLANIIVLTGLWMIGSDTAFPVMIAEFFVLFGICLRDRKLLTRYAELLGIWGLTAELTYILSNVLLHDVFVFVDENDAVNSLLRLHIGLLLIIVSVIMLAVIRFTGTKEWKKEALGNVFKVIAALMGIFVIMIIILMVVVTTTPEKAGTFANIRMLTFDDYWGTNRGINWKSSVAGFFRMNPFRKIVGMGQGNFEAYIYSFDDLKKSLDQAYVNFRLRVAHNEYLNMLIENGIIGLASYIGVLASSFAILWKKADKKRNSLIALASLSGYMASSIFFFQHFYATPFMYIFVAMALSEVNPKEKTA